MQKILLCMTLLFLCAACGSNEQAPAVVMAQLPETTESQAVDNRVDPEQETRESVQAGIDSDAVTAEPAQNQLDTTVDLIADAESPADEGLTAQPDDADNPADNEGVVSPEDAPDGAISENVDVWPEGLVSPYPAEYKTVLSESGLSNQKLGWYYNRNKDHQPPTAQRDFDIGLLNACYLGDITQKIVYLTFDEGYENGYTGTILDILQEKGVPAAFFLTKTYIRDNPELSARMAAEGHVAANHSVTHRSFPGLTDEEIEYELLETDRYFEEITGENMAPFFRPPSGEYSARTLSVTAQYGYKSVFWSFAYEDWLTDKQPGREAAFNRVMDNLHNGGIILLHAVSQSNTEALPDIIDAAREKGYSFGSLYDLP